ncbi:hypothetical protein TrLO_g4661 [Triparma laevis f. longispina]|uniref:Uncharacterized protein n=1 Tax=Triparma laevis f. longispina TaxID=1714387 RepID=A0A9W7CML5_9STRA|nr:hypothetical protein TrLO_g4661 [Triparma laevis f. longispina]
MINFSRVKFSSTSSKIVIVSRRAVTTDAVAARTRAWTEQLVVGKNLCPFAAAPLKDGTLRIHVSTALSDKEVVADVASEIAKLFPPPSSTTPSTATSSSTTTLVVFPYHAKLVESHPHQIKLSYEILANIQRNKSAHSDSLQIVNFHPRGQHSLYAPPDEISLETDDPYNFVTRSPFPTIHLLRTVDLIDASKFMSGDTEKIPLRNMERLRKDGRNKLLEEWSAI